MKPAEFAEKESFTLQDLLELLAILRGENGCPWDREQTHESIRNNLLEEAFEACEGIDKKDPVMLREELGDLLFVVLFHCSIAEKEGEFRTEDMIGEVCRKMIRRHPHIFSKEKIEEKDLQLSWDEIKKKEKGNRTLHDTLASVSGALPALMRAQKYIEKCRHAGMAPMPELSGLSKKEALGEKLYALCLEGKDKHLNAEEALNAYCKRILNESTKHE